MRRRPFIRKMGALGLAISTPVHTWSIDKMIGREIPSSGEKIPVIGMGSWLTFDVGGDGPRRDNMRLVLKTFHAGGGRVIDSSPMYGSSELVIGDLASDLGIVDDLWISTKVWTNGLENGQKQIRNSQDHFDRTIKVHHVHNIRDFEVQYETLKSLKAAGDLKYIGVTHYTNGAHSRLIDLLKKFPLDFVQFNYNIDNPAAEELLMKVARGRGIATIVNRPFQGGNLFIKTHGNPLPEWAKEMGVNNWAGYFLKFIISHEGVTCTIPATTQVSHVIENLQAGRGYLPSSKERTKMLNYYRQLN